MNEPNIELPGEFPEDDSTQAALRRYRWWQINEQSVEWHVHNDLLFKITAGSLGLSVAFLGVLPREYEPVGLGRFLASAPCGFPELFSDVRIS